MAEIDEDRTLRSLVTEGFYKGIGKEKFGRVKRARQQQLKSWQLGSRITMEGQSIKTLEKISSFRQSFSRRIIRHLPLVREL